MWINYSMAIQESDEELAAREWQLRGEREQVRVRMLRLLKSGQVRSMRACAPLLGYSIPQLSHWWHRYEQAGLAALVEQKRRPGKPTRMTPAAWAGLEEELRAGRMGSLEAARRYLQERWGITYQSVNGIWWQFKKHRVKLKTGRRRHRRADPAAQEAFKKLWFGAEAAGGGRGLGL